MITTTPSERFKETIIGPHNLSVVVNVLVEGAVADSIGIDGGSVVRDATAEFRGVCDVTLHDETLVPVTAEDLLTPYGNEIQIARGIKYSEDDTEEISLGIFRIEEIEVSDTGDSHEMRLTCQDRGAKVSDAKFEEPYNITSGTLATDAIIAIIEPVIDVEYVFSETTVTLPGLVAEEGDDRWELVQGIAEAIGAELFFDGIGRLVLQPIPQALDEPTRVITEGEEGVLIHADKLWTRRDTFNKVIVTAENTDIDPPVRAEAVDNNPNSPTYYYGPYGKVPRFWSSEFITTQAQADDAAQGILLGGLGISQAVDFGAVVDPSLSPSEVVTVTREHLGIDEAHILDSITIPLTAEEHMIASTRSVQIEET